MEKSKIEYKISKEGAPLVEITRTEKIAPKQLLRIFFETLSPKSNRETLDLLATVHSLRDKPGRYLDRLVAVEAGTYTVSPMFFDSVDLYGYGGAVAGSTFEYTRERLIWRLATEQDPQRKRVYMGLLYHEFYKK